MKKTKDTNKGITLIALVITIIVMLILVAVTITMAVNGGLFEQAGRAGSQTNEARDAEQEFANVQPDMTYDDLINKYTEGEEDNSQEGTENPEQGTEITFMVGQRQYSAKSGDTWASWTATIDDEFYSSGEYVCWGEFRVYDENGRVLWDADIKDGYSYSLYLAE